jgi:hypothetical protein
MKQVFSGQCGTVTNQFWGWLGLNPVCGMYNRIFAIITKAMLGDTTSWATIIGTVTATGATTRLTIKNIDNLAGAIADVIAPGGNLIGDTTTETSLVAEIPKIVGNPENILAITNSSSGGKRSKSNKRKHNKAKKSKKSRKSARKSKSRK